MDIDAVIIDMYRENKSTYLISEELNKQTNSTEWYANKVNRRLKKLGFPLRSKSQSQKLAIESGRTSHPTKGKVRPSKDRAKIGQTVKDTWKNASDEKKQSRKNKAKENWDKLTEEQKQSMLANSAKAVRRAADIGSKLERFILGRLREDSYKVDFHTTHELFNGTLELDLYLPELSVAIEVNGISHYKAIHGEEAFERVQYNDQMKNGMAIQNGLTMIRIKSTLSKVGISHCVEIYNKLITVLEEIKVRPNRVVEDRLVYIE